MGPSDLLRRVVDVLERLDIPYLVTGSMATIAYGEPRFTNDIDIVVDLPTEKVNDFCESFPSSEFYYSKVAVQQAVEQHLQFNIIHPQSGLKVDVIIPAKDAFDLSRLGRGIRVAGGSDFSAWFASPEDVILKKLEYFQLGGSEKHLRDIAGVLKIRGNTIDREYLANWVQQLGLTREWDAVLKRAKP